MFYQLLLPFFFPPLSAAAHNVSRFRVVLGAEFLPLKHSAVAKASSASASAPAPPRQPPPLLLLLLLVLLLGSLLCHESSHSAARSRVKERQTRISSLPVSQGHLVGYVCSTSQSCIMTDLRKTDSTEFTRRLYVPRGREQVPCAGAQGIKFPMKLLCGC